MAPTFPSPSGDSLGASPTQSRFDKMAPSGKPAAPPPSPRPYAWQLLEAARGEVHDTLTLLAGAVEDMGGWGAWAELQRESADAQLAYVQRQMLAPTLPPDPVVDLDELRKIAATLETVNGKFTGDCELIVDALKALRCIIARGAQP